LAKAKRLNQVVAIEKAVKGRADQEIMTADRKLSRAHLLAGLTRTYQPLDDNGEQLPPESTKVQVTVGDALADVATAMGELFDVTAMKDYGNCNAFGDVVIDGETLLAQVPVTYLLFLEKRLALVHSLVRDLPTLDPAEEWTFDKSSGYWRTEPTKTTRGRKVPKSQVLYNATEQHPAQVHVYHEDVTVGTWTQTKFSGAWPATRVREVLQRVRRLQQAVKQAREQANMVEVESKQVGAKLFEYMLSAA
jgi:hypothetical protein